MKLPFFRNRKAREDGEASDRDPGPQSGEAPAPVPRSAARPHDDLQNRPAPDRMVDPDDDVLQALGDGSRVEAETTLAEATYHLNRGNRERDPSRKLASYRQALEGFRRLSTLLPTDPTIRRQVQLIEQGVEDLSTMLERVGNEGPT